MVTVKLIVIFILHLLRLAWTLGSPHSNSFGEQSASIVYNRNFIVKKSSAYSTCTHKQAHSMMRADNTGLFLLSGGSVNTVNQPPR